MSKEYNIFNVTCPYYNKVEYIKITEDLRIQMHRDKQIKIWDISISMIKLQKIYKDMQEWIWWGDDKWPVPSRPIIKTLR